MFSYLQSKFTIPFYIKKTTGFFKEEGLSTINRGQHLELQSDSLIDLTAEVIPWLNEISLPVVWMRVETLDTDPGRFWTLFIYGLRKHYANLGKNLLAVINDHHFSPPLSVLEEFKRELSAKPFVMFLSGCENLVSGPIREQLSMLMEESNSRYVFVFLNDGGQSLFEKKEWIKPIKLPSQPGVSCSMAELSPQEKNFLSLLDVWWVEWLRENHITIDSFMQEMINHGEVDFLSKETIVPSVKIRKLLRDFEQGIDYAVYNQKINSLIVYLLKERQWLEVFRWTLLIKDFEQAAELLEANGFKWLDSGSDPLTLLFWLRELPSVLLTARPIPAFLAAQASEQLGLSTTAKIYLAHVENNLSALQKFSRTEEQFLGTKLSENGISVGELLTRIKLLKLKIG